MSSRSTCPFKMFCYAAFHLTDTPPFSPSSSFSRGWGNPARGGWDTRVEGSLGAAVWEEEHVRIKSLPPSIFLLPILFFLIYFSSLPIVFYVHIPSFSSIVSFTYLCFVLFSLIHWERDMNNIGHIKWLGAGGKFAFLFLYLAPSSFSPPHSFPFLLLFSIALQPIISLSSFILNYSFIVMWQP